MFTFACGALQSYIITICSHYSMPYNSVIEIVKKNSTAQRIGRQGKKDQRPTSNSEPTPYRGPSAASYRSQSRSSVPNRRFELWISHLPQVCIPADEYSVIILTILPCHVIMYVMNSTIFFGAPAAAKFGKTRSPEDYTE